jgi:NAD(P)-dependent dehydrogenase (short-subunit alcohol dehydrogenase family)
VSTKLAGKRSPAKYGLGAFSGSICQEVARRHVRVSLVEPGVTATELASHDRPEVLQSIRSQFGQTMEATSRACSSAAHRA